MAKVAELEAAEKDKMREKVQNIISHVINCFGNRQLTYNIPEEQFAEAGILVIEHADFDGIERLALVMESLHLPLIIQSLSSWDTANSLKK
ncbi:hypothetical protein KY284_028194 [Solanum tuberosum]|uniref:T-complex protein 1 beta subunit (TCP-1-beta) n=1 Tax=Solanum tuberosum TaxID=4113 RepID=M1AAN7_SOLTU|nr:hypothetical protein KY284_028194 [Solanum tuberosum]